MQNLSIFVAAEVATIFVSIMAFYVIVHAEIILFPEEKEEADDFFLTLTFMALVGLNVFILMNNIQNILFV